MRILTPFFFSICNFQILFCVQTSHVTSFAAECQAILCGRLLVHTPAGDGGQDRREEKTGTPDRQVAGWTSRETYTGGLSWPQDKSSPLQDLPSL